MKLVAGQCLHNMSGICSHGKHMNHLCVGKCEYFFELTQEVADSWNSGKGIVLKGNDAPNMNAEVEMQRKSFSYKKTHSATLDSLAMKVDQDELYEFDKFLKEQVELGLLSQERYELLYDKAYRHVC